MRWMGVFAFIFTSICIPVQAEQVNSYKVGNWFVGIHNDDTSGRFTSCIGSVDYKSGITLYVGVSREFEWDLGFSAENWKLAQGETFRLRYRFDRSRWTEATAEAVADNLVMMPMPTDGPVARLFRRSRTMEVQDGYQSYHFDLHGSSRLLVSLVECVRASSSNDRVASSGGYSNQSTSSGASSQAASDIVDDPALRLEGTRVLSNFLLAAELGGAEILGEPDFPKELSFAHAVAVAKGTIGFSFVVPDADLTPDALSGQIASTISESCEGKFGTGSTKENVENTRLISGFTACSKQGVKSFLQYVVVSRKQGGQYVIGVLSASPEAAGDTSSTTTAPAVTSERLMKAAYQISR